MSIYTSLLTAGTHSHEESSENANAFATDFASQGVIGVITNTSGVAPSTGAFAVNAQGTPDMTVAVSSGVAYVSATPTSQNSQRLRIRNTASANVTISANSSGSTKYDWVYLSVDATKAADPAVNADDVTTLVASRSSSSTSDNGTPPTFGVALAVVTVANGASTITNANIADVRIRAASVGGINDTNGNEVIKVSATASAVNEITVTNAATGNAPQVSATGADTNIPLKLSGKGTGAIQLYVNGLDQLGAWQAYTPTLGSIAIGTGGGAENSGYYVQTGKTVVARGIVLLGSSGASVSGDFTISLPVTADTVTSAVASIGNCTFIDQATNQYPGTVYAASTTTMKFRPFNAAGTYATSTTAPSSTVPFTWGSGDAIAWQIWYEAA